MRWKIAVGLALLSSTSVVAAPIQPSALHRVQRFFGSVNVHTTGESVIVALSENKSSLVDTLFTVEERGTALPSMSFRAENAEVLLWEGHLLVVAPDERRAVHFSMPGFPRGLRLESGSASSKLDPADLDDILRKSYDLTVLDTAVEILGRSGGWKGRLQLDDEMAQERVGAVNRHGLRNRSAAIDYVPYVKDDPSTGDSGGSSPTSCSQSCHDNSSCHVTCPVGTGGVSSTTASCGCDPSAYCECS